MISLECVKRTDPRYQDFRNRHYIPNRGTHGQQLHYVVYKDVELVGIISGASAVYGCAPRDKFFGLSKERKVKEAQINAIVNNVVFRLEHDRSDRNLATKVLSLWRRWVVRDWERLYGVAVAGFETFVIADRRDGVSDRLGTLYRADNWTEVGVTQGNTKTHEKTSGGGGMNVKHTRRAVEPKVILCLRRKKVRLPETYCSTWNDPEASKAKQKTRATLLARGALT